MKIKNWAERWRRYRIRPSDRWWWAMAPQWLFPKRIINAGLFIGGTEREDVFQIPKNIARSSKANDWRSKVPPVGLEVLDQFVKLEEQDKVLTLKCKEVTVHTSMAAFSLKNYSGRRWNSSGRVAIGSLRDGQWSDAAESIGKKIMKNHAVRDEY